MTPYFQQNGVSIYHGDALSVLKSLPDGCVQCCVTSPPYWGLRDYGTAQWAGGDVGCDHVYNHGAQGKTGQRADRTFTAQVVYRDVCGKCGAVREDAQIGMEATPEAYVQKMVEIFSEVGRVLRDDGCCFINLGDSYARNPSRGVKFQGGNLEIQDRQATEGNRGPQIPAGMKEKDLVGIPWMVAFALRAIGWYLRSEITWCKTAPMPESVTDRPTSATEKMFLFTKHARYFYDAEAVRVAGVEPSRQRSDAIGGANGHTVRHSPGAVMGASSTRNLWNYWVLGPEPFPEAHFATYPTKIVEPCILAGTSARGCCAECGAPWRRTVVASGGAIGGSWHDHVEDLNTGQRASNAAKGGNGYKRQTTGWEPTCACDAETVPCTVLDPFMGSGTTALVAQRLLRRCIGIELNADYIDLTTERLGQPSLFGNGATDGPGEPSGVRTTLLTQSAQQGGTGRNCGQNSEVD